MSLGFGIVSTGRHPDQKIAPAINRLKVAKLVAVYSRDREQAQAFAHKHGAEAAYDSYDALLKDPRVDAVFVASPNFLHAEHTVKAAQAGKHVLCEKPMALTLADCHTMIDTCRRQGVKLGIGYHLRYHPGHQEARRLVAAGALGTASLVQGQWSSGERGQVYPPLRSGRMEWWNRPEMVGAGSLVGMGVHPIDLLRYVLGQEVVEVMAMTDGQTRERPLDQLTTVLLRFQGGTIGMVYASRRTPEPMNHLILHGSQGRIACYDSIYAALQGRLEVRVGTEVRTQTYETDDSGMYAREIEAFCQAVALGQEPSASGWDGLKLAQIALAVIESAKTGRLIRLGVP